MIKKIWKNKVFRTFFQAFIGTFCAGFVLGLNDKELIALLVSAISAGICAIMNIGNYES